MASLIAAGIRFTVEGIQSGIQAHKDFNSHPNSFTIHDSSESSSSRAISCKKPHLVYGWVMKANERLDKGKGRSSGISIAPPKANQVETAPPSYETVVTVHELSKPKPNPENINRIELSPSTSSTSESDSIGSTSTSLSPPGPRNAERKLQKAERKLERINCRAERQVRREEKIMRDIKRAEDKVRRAGIKLASDW